LIDINNRINSAAENESRSENIKWESNNVLHKGPQSYIIENVMGI